VTALLRAPDLVPAEARGEALAAALAPHVRGRRVLVPRAEEGRPELVDGLARAGADVVAPAAYRTVAAPPEALAPLGELLRAGAIDAIAWRAAARAVRSAATRLTHPIGAALLGDLLDGDGWAPLHDLARALAHEDDATALDAARRLTQLGHSSGWDLLAGFIAGARG
jgi:hypothetical protein